MTTEAIGSVPHNNPPASARGAIQFGGESEPDMLLEGLKYIRKKKEETRIGGPAKKKLASLSPASSLIRIS